MTENKQNKSSNGGSGQLIWGVTLLLIGTVATVISYNSAVPGGYYYVYFGAIMFGAYWLVSGIYNVLHPKKNFDDVSLARITRKFVYFSTVLIIVLLIIGVIITIINAFKK